MLCLVLVPGFACPRALPTCRVELGAWLCIACCAHKCLSCFCLLGWRDTPSGLHSASFFSCPVPGLLCDFVTCLMLCTLPVPAHCSLLTLDPVSRCLLQWWVGRSLPTRGGQIGGGPCLDHV